MLAYNLKNIPLKTAKTNLNWLIGLNWFNLVSPKCPKLHKNQSADLLSLYWFKWVFQFFADRNNIVQTTYIQVSLYF